MSGLGERLRAAREAQRMTLAEAELRTRVRAAQLAALEQQDFAALPARVYLQGMVRLYSACLGLDPDEASRELDAALGPNQAPSVRPHVRSLSSHPAGVASVVAGVVVLLVLLVLVGLGYLLWQGDAEPTIGSQIPVAKGAAAPPSADEMPRR